MTQNKDLKRLVRSRMQQTGERYTTALVELTGGDTGRPPPSRRAYLDDLIQRLGDKRLRNDAMTALVGGVTATELRRVERLPDDTFEALLRGLGDPRPPVRWWCIQVLDHVPDVRALVAVADLLDDPVDRVRRNAIHALGCLACKPSADPVLPGHLMNRIAEIARTDPSAKVRREAVFALACRTEASSGESVS